MINQSNNQTTTQMETPQAQAATEDWEDEDYEAPVIIAKSAGAVVSPRSSPRTSSNLGIHEPWMSPGAIAGVLTPGGGKKTTPLEEPASPTGGTKNDETPAPDPAEDEKYFSKLNYSFFRRELRQSDVFYKAFQYMESRGMERFTNLQCKMLTALLAGESFQVTSGCGSGKTFILLFAFIACMSQDATLVYVYDNAREHKELRKQIVRTIEAMSDNMLACVDLGDAGRHDRDQLIQASAARGVKVYLTPCGELHNLTKHVSGELVFAFDECQTMFGNDDSSQRYQALISNALYETIHRQQVICLSAVGDVQTKVAPSNRDDASTSSAATSGTAGTGTGGNTSSSTCENIDAFMASTIGKALPVLNHNLALEENLGHQTYIVYLTLHDGIYEQTMDVILRYLTPDRNLIVCRPQQVDLFVQIIRKELPTVTITSNRDCWNNPDYRVIVAREDELKHMEGLNFSDLTGVFLTTIASPNVVHRSIQAVGRVGRLGQTSSRAFVFMDKTNSRNAQREAESQDILQAGLTRSSLGTRVVSPKMCEQHERLKMAATSSEPKQPWERCCCSFDSIFNCSKFKAPSTASSEDQQERIKSFNDAGNRVYLCPYPIDPKQLRCLKRTGECKYCHPLSRDIFDFRGGLWVDGSRYYRFSHSSEAFKTFVCPCSETEKSYRCPQHWREAPKPTDEQIAALEKHEAEERRAARAAAAAERAAEERSERDGTSTAAPTHAQKPTPAGSTSSAASASSLVAATPVSRNSLRPQTGGGFRPAFSSSSFAAASSDPATNRATGRFSLRPGGAPPPAGSMGMDTIARALPPAPPTTAPGSTVDAPVLETAAAANQVDADGFVMAKVVSYKGPAVALSKPSAIHEPTAVPVSTSVSTSSTSAVATGGGVGSNSNSRPPYPPRYAAAEGAGAAAAGTRLGGPSAGPVEPRPCRNCCLGRTCAKTSADFIHKGDPKLTGEQISKIVCRIGYANPSKCHNGRECRHLHGNSEEASEAFKKFYRPYFIESIYKQLKKPIAKCTSKLPTHDALMCTFIHASDGKYMSESLKRVHNIT